MVLELVRTAWPANQFAGRVPRSHTSSMQASPILRRILLHSILLSAAIAFGELNRLQAAATEQTQKIVGAANVFLGTLDDIQRGKVNFDFNDAAQRKRWSNLPVGMAERRGLRMGDLKQDQRDAVMKLLATVLSKMGYEKVVGIVESDEVLRKESRGGP